MLARFFRNKFFLLVVITIVILIVMAISSRPNSKINIVSNIINVPLSPLQKLFSFSGEKVESSITFFKDLKSLKEENEQLKLKLEKLERERNELLDYKKENNELRKALNLKNQFNDYDFIGANIIAKDAGNWFNVFKIDRGTQDKVVTDLPVVTNEGLVGRVVSSGTFSSKVISIIDMDSTVSGRISKTRDLVRVKGDLTLKEQGLCRMDYIPFDVDIAVGDTIETSGLGGVYPKGIIIGKVQQVRLGNSEINRYAIIEPTVDFKRLEEVFVLRSISSQSEAGSVE